MDTASVTEIGKLTFGVLQLNSVLDSLTAWMSGEETSFAVYEFEQRVKVAVSYFVKNPIRIELGGPYLTLLRAAEKLKEDHGNFIAAHCEGSIVAMQQETRVALRGLADILDGLGYPESKAASLRNLSART